MWSDQVLFALLVAAVLASLFINSIAPVVLPLIAGRVLHDAVALGLFVAAYGIGGLVGMVVIAAVGDRIPRRPAFAFYFLVAPFCFAILAVLPAFAVVFVISFVIGLSAGITSPIGRIVRFERSPPAMRARVLGLTTAAFMITGPIAVLLIGLLIDRIGLEPTLLVAAIGHAVISGVVVLHPAMRLLDESRGWTGSLEDRGAHAHRPTRVPAGSGLTDA